VSLGEIDVEPTVVVVVDVGHAGAGLLDGPALPLTAGDVVEDQPGLDRSVMELVGEGAAGRLLMLKGPQGQRGNDDNGSGGAQHPEELGHRPFHDHLAKVRSDPGGGSIFPAPSRSDCIKRHVVGACWEPGSRSKGSPERRRVSRAGLGSP